MVPHEKNTQKSTFFLYSFLSNKKYQFNPPLRQAITLLATILMIGDSFKEPGRYM